MTQVGFTAKGLDSAAQSGADITLFQSIYQLLWAASVNWPPCTCGGGAASHSPAMRLSTLSRDERGCLHLMSAELRWEPGS